MKKNADRKETKPIGFGGYLKKNLNVMLIAPVIFTVFWNLIALMSSAIKGRTFSFSPVWNLIVPFFGCAAFLVLMVFGIYREEKKKGKL